MAVVHEKSGVLLDALVDSYHDFGFYTISHLQLHVYE